MTRYVSLLLLGVGRVGAEVTRIIARQTALWQAEYDIAVQYAVLADSTAFMRTGDSGASTSVTGGQSLNALLAARAEGRRFAAIPAAVSLDAWRDVLASALDIAGSPADLVVLDCAVGPDTTPLLLAARAAGAHAVLANKDPLVGPQSQFDALRHSPSGGSLRASATVGAGLPILAAIERATTSGDRLITLDARASGSLGFLCDRLSSGVSFDTAVRAAEAQGYTEPDPRQDLSGFDVARKLLILARVVGWQAELADVRVESLVPPGAEALSLDAFRAALPDYRDFLADRAQAARAGGRVLRYIGRVAEDGTLSAGLVDLSSDDPLARGAGPENVFRLRTTRYDAYPLTISGPGAGIAVTAGAVVADLLCALEVL